MVNGDNLFDHYLTGVKRYIDLQCWDDVPMMEGYTFIVTPLAQGEYNLNYLLSSKEVSLVFRVNIGTQINRDDQIVYEYNALQLLQDSGVTPVPYFVDDSRTLLDRGISIMEYLPGCHLDYRIDLAGAAKTFATIHQITVSAQQNHLIVEKQPLSLIFSECEELLERYFHSDLAQPYICNFLREVLEWARTEKKKNNISLTIRGSVLSTPRSTLVTSSSTGKNRQPTW